MPPLPPRCCSAYVAGELPPLLPAVWLPSSVQAVTVSVLVAALNAGICDGVVSGVAGVLPELITVLYERRDSAAYPRAVELLAELIRHLSAFPVPWGLKLVAECRGITAAWFSQPLSAARTAQAHEFRDWFRAWWSQCEKTVGNCSTKP